MRVVTCCVCLQTHFVVVTGNREKERCVEFETEAECAETGEMMFSV